MKSKLIALLLLVSFGAQAQYSLSFEKPTLDGNKFRVTLHINAVGKTFGLGSNNLRFSYPIAGLANPKIVSEVFPGSVYHETTLVGSNANTGIVSVNTVYFGKAKTNKMPITKKGMDLVELEFDVLNPALVSELAWRVDGKQPKTAILTDDRLTIVDAAPANNAVNVKNAKFTAPVRVVEESKLLIANIMPNPAKDDVSVVFDAVTNGTVQVVMTDVLGRTVKSQKMEASKGVNTLMLNISALSFGTYTVKITDGISESVEKLVKQ
jgi:hypothetical protein